MVAQQPNGKCEVAEMTGEEVPIGEAKSGFRSRCGHIGLTAATASMLKVDRTLVVAAIAIRGRVHTISLVARKPTARNGIR